MTVVRLRHGEIERAVFVVVEQRGETVIRIRTAGDEHLTLHRDGDEVLLTHRSTEKPPSVWDEARVEAARRCGYKNPERHGDYYQHRPLYPPAINEQGHFLVGKRVNIASASRKAEYDRAPGIVLDAPAPECMVGIWLTAPGQSLAPDEPRVQTSFGDLYFRLALR